MHCRHRQSIYLLLDWLAPLRKALKCYVSMKERATSESSQFTQPRMYLFIGSRPAFFTQSSLVGRGDDSRILTALNSYQLILRNTIEGSQWRQVMARMVVRLRIPFILTYQSPGHQLTHCAHHRRRPLLSLLAGGHGLLRCQHLRRRRLWQAEVRARTRGLLRVPSPQERGQSWRAWMGLTFGALANGRAARQGTRHPGSLRENGHGHPPRRRADCETNKEPRPARQGG